MTREICGEAEVGIHARSTDTVRWELAEAPKAYSRTVRWDDGTTTECRKLERPQWLKTNGQPTHLFAATLKTDSAGNVLDSGNCVLPLT